MISRQNLDKADYKVEILAPAGSYESFLAAVHAGADAVYAGGPRFGARAYAENFTEDMLKEAMDYAHLHGRRFYLTVNTLVKDSELFDLKQYLEPLYLAGLDAVIVQDPGVFRMVRRYFPEMEIHASTQMTITGTSGAQFLKEQGAVRVVPARELSLEEIRDMKEKTGMEIECFVHGALCYCYSGQCLLSSLIGGRSGNRGQCAQPCRLPYSADGEKGYLLSLKDICTLDLIPDLIEAGIDSFKIEGRMKRPEYVAGVVSAYRKYVDLYMKKGRKGYKIDAEDKERLMDLYNRGGFSQGYYKQRNGRSMLADKRPNHAGVRAVKVLSQSGRELTIQALTDIHKGDVLEFSASKENYTYGRDLRKQDKMKILAPKGQRFAPGSVLSRIRNQKLIDSLQEYVKDIRIQEKIYGFLRLSIGKPATLVVRREDISVEIQSEQIVQAAAKSPLDETRVRKNMMKTGNTDFVFEQLDIEIEGNVFLPVQQLNEMRREALDTLREKICDSMRRENTNLRKHICGSVCRSKTDHGEHVVSVEKNTSSLFWSVYVETLGQLGQTAAHPEISRVYVSSTLGGDLLRVPEAAEYIRKIQDEGREVYLALPHIFRNASKQVFLKRLDEWKAFSFDGLLLRNMESIVLIEIFGMERAQAVLDSSVYVMNHEAETFWKEQGFWQDTIPPELNCTEISRLLSGEKTTLYEDEKKDEANSLKQEMCRELVVYGHLPVMISAQCVANTVHECKKEERVLTLKDRVQKVFYVQNHCRDCYNVIYNGDALCLFDEKDALLDLSKCGLGRFGLRMQFTIESEEETERILNLAGRIFSKEDTGNPTIAHFTRGHFRRGVS